MDAAVDCGFVSCLFLYFVGLLTSSKICQRLTKHCMKRPGCIASVCPVFYVHTHHKVVDAHLKKLFVP